MTATAHAVTGAVVAVVLKNPLLAIPAAFISHFVIDAIPHFVVGNDPSERGRKKMFWFANLVDASLAIYLLGVLPTLLEHRASFWVTLLCMAAAIAPDFPWIWRQLKEGKTSQKNWYDNFHIWIQWCERQWGIWVELGWVAAMSVVLVSITK